MKYFGLVLLSIVILGGVLLGGRESIPIATINGHVLQLEIARTPEEQTRGLSGKESLAENTGMLFVYEKPFIPSFWMKDMNFSIDIIWIGEDKKIVDITENISPETFPNTFKPKAPVQYVLEVNAGWAKNHNVSTGNGIILNLDE